jgi:putative Mn2+ efflux pump MntP
VWEAIALSFGLAMDATAVSAARGLSGHRPRELAILPLLFGGFQSAMAGLGWLGGRYGGQYIERYQHWVAFVLLAGIGIKMIVEAWKGDDEKPGTSLAVYLGLALATSIDAAAAGVTLPLLSVEPWLALLLIGTITAACSAAGYFAGRRFSGIPKLEIVGGLVLVGMGIELLVRGL